MKNLIKNTALNQSDFEKHDFKLRQQNELFSWYEKEVKWMLVQLTNKHKYEIINLLIVNKTPHNTHWYREHQFRDMKIDKSEGLDFLLSRCFIYNLLYSD